MEALHNIFVVFVITLLAPGVLGIECYACREVNYGANALMDVLDMFSKSGCSDLRDDTPLPTLNCTGPKSQCTYMRVLATNQTPGDMYQIFESSYEIEIRDCVNVSIYNVTEECIDGVLNQQAWEILRDTHLSDHYRAGRSCFCDKDRCDAKQCRGLSLLGPCVKWYVLFVSVGATVGVLLLIITCCFCCSKRSEAYQAMKPSTRKVLAQHEMKMPKQKSLQVMYN